jgi:hypothetical protein
MNCLQRKLGLNFWVLLLATVLLSACEQQINFPKPSLKSMSPTTAQAGGTAFTLTVNGKSFSPGSLVEWNGNALVTTFLTTSQMTTKVPASDCKSGYDCGCVLYLWRRHIGHFSYSRFRRHPAMFPRLRPSRPRQSSPGRRACYWLSPAPISLRNRL